MPASAKARLLFLPPKTVSNKSKRQLELEDQQARAHAATISHYRAGRDGTRKPRIHQAQSVATASGAVLHATGMGFAVSQRQSQPVSTSQGLAWIKTGPLDPFLRLPTDLNARDRNLLFVYLDRTPRLVHGVKQNPAYCPVRECTIVSIADSALFLQWIIFMAEMMTGASKTTIFARRAAIYADTRKVLQDPANFMLDTTLLHLVVASLAETRLGNLELAHKHFTGLLQVLSLRNGLRTFQEIGLHLGLGMLHAFVVGQVPLFRTENELLAALDRMRIPRARKPIPPLIRRHFGICPSHGAHLGNLHMLNMVLMEEPDGYIDRLLYYVMGSGDNLTPVAMTFMIAQSAVDIGQWYGPDPLVKSWETIEFVQLIAYTAAGKAMTIKALSSWLTGDKCFSIDLEALKVGILEAWLACYLDEPVYR